MTSFIRRNHLIIQVISCCSIKFGANKLVLGYSSVLLGKIFQTGCDLATHLDLTYDILCPEFEPEAVKRILEILYTGETYINTNNLKLYKEMKSILSVLQISMTLPDLAQSYTTPESILGIKEERTDDGESAAGSGHGPLKIGEVFQPLICTLCDSEFQHPEDFQKHLDSHTGVSENQTIEEIDLESDILHQNTSNEDSDNSVDPVDQPLSPERKKMSNSEGSSRKKSSKNGQGSFSEGGNSKRPFTEAQSGLEGNKDKKPRKSNATATKSSSSEAGIRAKQQRSIPDDSESPRQIVRYYKCYLCKTEIGHYSNLLYHLSTNHFAEETRKFFGAKEWSCSLCSDDVTSESQLIRHLVIF